MRHRFLFSILLLVSVCFLNDQIKAEEESIVTVSPATPEVGQKVTIIPNTDFSVLPGSWKVVTPSTAVVLKPTSNGISFTPDKDGNWKISFSWHLTGLDDADEAIKADVTIKVKPKTTKTVTPKKASANKDATRFQESVNKLLKESHVFHFDENYSKNVMTLAKEIRAKNSIIQQAADRAAIVSILDEIENNFLENTLKDKSDDIKSSWKNFFNALRRRLDITLQVFEENKLKLDKIAPLVQSFADALMTSAEQEVTRIENYEVNRATYMNYMNKYPNGNSKFNKHHKYRKFRKHKHFYYKN